MCWEIVQKYLAFSTMSKKNFSCRKIGISPRILHNTMPCGIGLAFPTCTGLALGPGAAGCYGRGHCLGKNPLWNQPRGFTLPGWELPTRCSRHSSPVPRRQA